MSQFIVGVLVMGSAKEDVASEAASATLYRTYTDLELLQKHKLEAEGATAAYKVLQIC